jgi:photosystem II stability/assembly factor-like uncharacterized protein
LPIGYAAVLCVALSPGFADDGVIFAGTEEHGLLRSADGGRSWAPAGTGVWSEAINSVVLDGRDRSQPELLVLHGSQLLHSADGGTSWESWRTDRLAGHEITAVLAPLGFADDAPILIGLTGGAIMLV